MLKMIVLARLCQDAVLLAQCIQKRKYMPETVAVCWLRRDLRLEDNAALFHAHKSGLPVIVLFIFDRNILDELDPADARVEFIHDRLMEMHESLRPDAGMDIRYGFPDQVWSEVLDDYRVEKVFFNRDFEPYAKDRDAGIVRTLQKRDIDVHVYTDHVLLDTDAALKDDGEPYRVFTPFSRTWRSALVRKYGDKDQNIKDIALPIYTVDQKDERYGKPVRGDIPSLEEMGFSHTEIPIPSPDLSPKTLEAYGKQRDYPAKKATSRVGVHLRFGTLSIRKAARAALKYSDTFLNELIWREFYTMILDHFPRVIDESFRPEYDRIEWRNNQEQFKAWCEGRTGYPMVDAGMRQLNQTGYMHNRVRMVVASFLTKHLLIDWRWGEQYFAKKLLDYELASNNGGWQWAAGSGTDAAPYFRIFNPASQQKKFDPEGEYVRAWIPELDEMGYPDPIVDHKEARERCLRVYKAALQD